MYAIRPQEEIHGTVDPGQGNALRCLRDCVLAYRITQLQLNAGIGAEGFLKCLVKIGAVNLPIGGPVAALRFGAEARFRDRFTGTKVAKARAFRCCDLGFQGGAQAQAQKYSAGIRGELDASTSGAMGGRLLQHDDLVSTLAERKGRREAAEAATRYSDAVAHGFRPFSA